MTWRKLFRRTAAVSTLLLVVVWLHSLCYRTEISFYPRPFRLSLAHATLEVRATEHHPGKGMFVIGGGRSSAKGFRSFFAPTGFPGGPSWFQRTFSVRPIAVTSTRAANLLGTWKQEREREGQYPGFIPMGRMEDEPFSIHKTVHFPLWAPWSVVIAAAFAFCKAMERRASSGEEKKLAEGILLIDRLAIPCEKPEPDSP